MMPESACAITTQGSTEPAGNIVLIKGSNNPSADALRTERDFAN
jgi:hypothetical protein